MERVSREIMLFFLLLTVVIHKNSFISNGSYERGGLYFYQDQKAIIIQHHMIREGEKMEEIKLSI